MSGARTPLLDEQACFRYRVIAEVQAEQLGGAGRAEAVRTVACRMHVDEQGRPRQISGRTIYRWLAAYEDQQLAGLVAKARPVLQGSGVLPPKLLPFLGAERDRDRDASIPELLRRAELKDVIASAQALDRTTVFRAMQRMGIETRRRKMHPQTDKRRFRYPHRMQLTICDFKHFRAGARRAKRAAVYLLDDATRYGLDVKVATSEKPEPVLHLLHDVISTYGLMSLLYWDGGPGFRDLDVLAVCAALSVGPIRGRARYPEGHGAIERFNRSAKARVLRLLDGAKDVAPDCDALTLRLRHDLLEVYNHLPHEALDGMSPHQRFHQDSRPLRPAPSTAWLRQCFTVTFTRRVSADHIVPVAGTDYEVPRGYSGKRLTLARRLLECKDDTDAIYMTHQAQPLRLHPVDLARNARGRRAPRPDESNEQSAVLAKSASHLAFERDLPRMVGPDGGYQGPENSNNKKKE